MIKNILYVQPVFAPDQVRLEKNINSIKSFGQYLRANGKDGMNLAVVMGGWARTDELWNAIVEACKEAFNGKVVPVRFDRNYGKAFTVNRLVQLSVEGNIKFDAILTADSDILFTLDTPNMFMRLATAALRVEARKGKPFGMMALNQLGECCHWKVCYENTLEYDLTVGDKQYKEKIVWPNNPSGIAGGCLFIGRKMWEVVSGYRVMGCYSGEDAFILIDAAQKGFSYQMSDSIGIIHPMETDSEYAKWKRTVCQRDSFSGIKGNLDPYIKDADEFWENKDKNK